MNDITLHRLKNPDAYPTRQVKKEFKFEMFLQMTVAIPHTVKGVDMTTTYTIFEYMVEIPKASHWLLSKVLSYRNTKSNIATVVGSTPYEKEMIKTGTETVGIKTAGPRTLLRVTLRAMVPASLQIFLLIIRAEKIKSNARFIQLKG